VKLNSDEGAGSRMRSRRARARTCYGAADASLQLRAETIGGATLLSRLPARDLFQSRDRARRRGARDGGARECEMLERYRAAGVAEFWSPEPGRAPAETPRLAHRARPRAAAAPQLGEVPAGGPEPYAARSSGFGIREAAPERRGTPSRGRVRRLRHAAVSRAVVHRVVRRTGWRFVVAEADGAVAATGAVFIDGKKAWFGVGATLASSAIAARRARF